MGSPHHWLFGSRAAVPLFALLAAVAVTPLAPRPSVAQGVYSGTKGAPMPFIEGVVAKIASKGPPLKLKETPTKVRLVKAYYRGTVLPGSLAKPTEGNVQEAYIGDMKLTLNSTDISSGYLKTKEFGDVELLFAANVLVDRCFFAMTADQLAKLK